MLLDLFYSALKAGLNPALLEFDNLGVCAINPKESSVLPEIKSSSFFPSLIGYFSYEFYEQLFPGLINRPSKPKIFPDKIFKLYEEGWVFKNNQLLEEPRVKLEISKFTPKKIPQREIINLVSKKDFFAGIKNIKNSILEGDVYQVNLSMPFCVDLANIDILNIYYYLKQNNPGRFMGLFCHDNKWVISMSPERLFSLKDGLIITEPMAGTKRRDADIRELTDCPKENAEHIMLVDLLRNDLNQVCRPGSVIVTQDRKVEFYTHVMHLVSKIEGRTHASFENIMKAIFPGGTVTGAPKKNVLKAIYQEEPFSRGPYTGSFGYISSGYGIDFNMLIRSIYVNNNTGVFNAGAGIVIDSIEENEWLEVHKKAEGIKRVFSG